MKNHHYERSDCPSYAGEGKCKFPGCKCAYNIDGDCNVLGNLEGKLKAKTRYESENDIENFHIRIGNTPVMS